MRRNHITLLAHISMNDNIKIGTASILPDKIPSCGLRG
jgi:hypothetical protein